MSVLQIVITSTRPGRIGASIGEWFTEFARAHGGFEVRVTDLVELGLPLLDESAHPSEQKYEKEHTRAWSAAIDEADAVVFVMPEYNFSFPASAKNAVDFLYYEWQFKPASLVSYGGTSGGLRSTQAFKPVLSTLKMFALPEQVTIQFAGQHVDESGFTPTDGHNASAKVMLDELTFLAPHFRKIREALDQ